MAPAPQVGTLSATVAKTAFIQDILQTQRIDARCGAAIVDLYALLNRAEKEKSAQVGANMLRAGIPPVIDRFEAAYPSTEARMGSAHLRTATGEKLRQIDLLLIGNWHQQLPPLRDDITKSRIAWSAVERFGVRNNRSYKQIIAKIKTLITGLPDDQRTLLANAVHQLYGP